VKESLNEFRAWLKLNHWLFETHGADEIACLAKFVGFTDDVIFSVLSHWRLAQEGADIDRVAAFVIQHEVLTINLLLNPLTESWEDLAKHDKGRD
jgi:hypothetical protein